MELKFAKFGILYVDDELKSLKYFREIFEDIAPIYTASNGEEGISVFQKHCDEIGMVLSDQRMPGGSGIEFLKRIREIDDNPLRVLVTAFADLNMAVESLNSGLLYSYLTKPWDPDELEGRLIRGLKHFGIRAERDELLSEKAAAFQQLMMAEKAATIGVLSSGLNHHMRNALTVIQPFFDMIPDQLREEIRGEPKDSFFWEEYYGDVRKQLTRITAILSNLSEGVMGHNRGGEGLNRQDGLDIASVMGNAAREVLGENSSISFSLQKDESLPLISADTQKITRMAYLLIQDAKMNIEDEGAIEVILSRHKQDVIHVSCIDNGFSIPDSHRRRLFDPLYVRQDRPSEVGMNLMTCYLTVFQHGGTIIAERLQDGRNAILLTLPVEAIAPAGNDSLTQLFSEFPLG